MFFLAAFGSHSSSDLAPGILIDLLMYKLPWDLMPAVFVAGSTISGIRKLVGTDKL